MIVFLATFVTAIAVAALLIGHCRESATSIAVAKATASASFVVLAASRWTAGSNFDSWMLAGLLLGAVGDLLLLSERSFDAGLGSFLFGHVCFSIAFHGRLPISEWPVCGLMLMVVLAVVVYVCLRPHLGRRRIPVGLYIAATAVMVWGALSVSWLGALPWWTGLAGALFMISDITVARQRFIHPGLVNRAVGLPMYYTAQILLAFTIGR